MTKQELTSLNLGLNLDTKTEIMLNAGIEWLQENTTIDTANTEKFPSGAKLFLIKFCDIQKMQTGVASESIEGLSLSFDTSNKSDLIWQLAEELLGKYLKGRVRFVAASSRWK